MINQNHLLTLLDYSPEEILELIELARTLKQEKRNGNVKNIRSHALNATKKRQKVKPFTNFVRLFSRGN